MIHAVRYLIFLSTLIKNYRPPERTVYIMGLFQWSNSEHDIMNTEEISKKIEISWKAAEIYHSKGSVSVPQIIEATEYTATEIYQLFPNKKAILEFFYPSMIFQYQAMVDDIEDFDTYSVSEKFSNFILTTFDMLDDFDVLAQDTFTKYILQERHHSEFFKEVKQLFKEFLTSDGNISVSAGLFMKDYFYGILSAKYIWLIKFWLEDKSEGKDRTTALADKFTAFLEEAIYNKTIDKGFDLIKYMVSLTDFNNPFSKAEDFFSDLFSSKKEEETEHE